MFEIGLHHYLVVAALVFCAGVFVMVTKRNAIGILIGVELVLNAVNINLVAFWRYQGFGSADGQIRPTGRSWPCSSSYWRPPRRRWRWPSARTSTRTSAP
jgi:hypothetical protein